MDSAVSRRGFIVAASVAASGIAAAPGGPTLLEMSAGEAVAAMRKGEMTAEHYATALLAQCERGKALNAFITLDREGVREAARAADKQRKAGGKSGLLHGLPIPVKDSINTKDLRTTAGTPALRDFHPKEDAPVVRKLREAGAIVLGKTNLHELSLGWTSNNQAFGAVHNPYDATRIPGGSSGGTAVAIASRMAPLGVAEDTEGSIRVPAALCGIAGFRPTTGRYPSSGVVPISALFDQVGPHARSVADLGLFDTVMTGEAGPLRGTLKGLKLGVARGYFWGGLDPEVERIANLALQKLRDAGVQLVEGDVEELAALVQRTVSPIQIHDVLHTLPKYLQDSGAGVTLDQVVGQSSSDLKAFFARVLPGGRGFVTEEVYRAAVDTHLPRMKENYKAYFARTGVAAIVFPATMTPATKIGQDEVMIGEKKLSFSVAISRNIAPGSTAGIPGLILPAGLTQSGLPVSLELDGPAGSDRALLAIGAEVEKLLGRLPAPQL